MVLGLLGLVFPAAADLKQDILDLTGGVRAKAVWVRSDPSQSLDNLYNKGASSILMGVSSDDGAIKTIDAVRTNHSMPLISRTGDYVVWNDDPAGPSHAFGGSAPQTVSWICKWDGSGRQKLLDGAAGDPGYVFSFMLDDRTNQEWVYTGRMGSKSMDIYRYPFTQGAVDKTKREPLCTVAPPEYTFLVSGEGKYIGGNFPWPNAFRMEVAGCKLTQLNVTDDWSCWAQVSPDLTGRAAHMKGDHANIQMYQVTTAQGAGTLINLNKNMPGNRGTCDCAGFRWSNHTQFLSSSYPLGIDVKPLGIPKFCIGRFNAAFTTVEKWVALPDSSSRSYNDLTGDFWLANGQGLSATGVAGNAVFSKPSTKFLTITRRESMLNVSVPSGRIRALIVLNTAGRMLTSSNLADSRTYCSLPMKARDVVIVKIVTEAGSFVEMVPGTDR